MIIDYIKNNSMYDGFNKRIVHALSFIKDTDLQSLDIGKHHIDGDDIFCIVDEYETKLEDDAMLEAHQKYIDVQTVISGSEYIGHEMLLEQDVTRKYDEAHDYTLYRGEPTFFKLVPGTFVIFFPDDLHMPGINKNKLAVKKLVVKVRL